jgi:hypothetical protein
MVTQTHKMGLRTELHSFITQFSLETSVSVYEATLYHSPEDLDLNYTVYFNSVYKCLR